MINRRTIMGTSAAAAAGGAGLGSARSAAAAGGFAGDYEPRGTVGRLERLPTLELESLQDFLTSFRAWTDSSDEEIYESNRVKTMIARV